MTIRFVPYGKNSKKEQDRIRSTKRRGWNDLNLEMRMGKAYNRNKLKIEDRKNNVEFMVYLEDLAEVE